MISLQADAVEFRALSRAIGRLPGDIKAKAFARAMRRMRDMARTRIVNRSAEHSKAPKHLIRARTTARVAAVDSIETRMKSDWIGLYKYGARQTRTGVTVKGRGSYKSAFLAKVGSGHVGVFDRVGSARLPIQELFGANPAHAIANNPDVYLEVLAGLIDEALMPRVLHELSRLMPAT